MDFISKLPDSVLISIISLIKTDEAVRTSILAKRWTNLYKFVPEIKFICLNFVDRSTYCDLDVDVDHTKAFVDLSRFLELHSGPIRALEAICCLTKSSAQAFEQCIHTLGESGIEMLYLYFSCRGQLNTGADFPCHLISHMPSLKKFDIVSCYLQPSPVISSSLNALKLSAVVLDEGSLECILSGCLNLHTLMIGGSQFSCPDKKARFCGPNLQLKCLMIQKPKGVESIEVYASNLVTFELYSDHIDVTNDVNFEYAPQLQNVYLCLYDIRVVPNVCRKLAKDLPNLKAFAYETRGYDVHQRGGSNISMSINYVFSCLKLLRLDMSLRHEFDLLSLIPLLHSCPLLQEFQLAASEGPLKYNGPEEVEITSVITAPHLHLKKVDMSGFSGSKNEINFALYILKSAVGLEEMFISFIVSKYSGFGDWRIDPGPKWGQETNKEIQEKLKNQAVSTSARVIVQPCPRFKWKWFTNYAILVD